MARKKTWTPKKGDKPMFVYAPAARRVKIEARAARRGMMSNSQYFLWLDDLYARIEERLRAIEQELIKVAAIREKHKGEQPCQEKEP